MTMEILRIEDKLTNVLKSIRVPEEFCENDGIDSEYWDKYDIIFESGATKAVLIIHGCDKVIKIPYNCDCCGCEFEYASDGGRYDSSWDYCNTEAEMYEVVEEMGLGQFFAKTEFWGYDKDHHPLYVQEKVMTYWQYRGKHYENKPSYDASEKAKKYYGCGERLSTSWIAAAIDYYGEESVATLMEYLQNNEDGIGYDLHDDNVGFRENGAPVILDYSGYFE